MTKKIALLSISLLLTVLLARYFNIDFYHNYILYILIFISCWWLSSGIDKILNKRLAIHSGIFSFLLTTSFFIGGKITPGNDILTPFYWSDIIYFLTLNAVLFFAVSKAINWLSASRSIKTRKFRPTKKIWVAASAIMFLGWMPYFLAFFPGILSPDSIHQLSQALGTSELTNAHPAPHTMLISAVVHFGLLIGNNNIVAGVASYSIVQMLLLSAILGYSVYWAARHSLSRPFCVLATAFFTLNPIIAIYSITMWKDVLFGGIILLLVLQVYDIVKSKGSAFKQLSSMIPFVATIILAAFFRNNGIFIIVVLLPLLMIVYRQYWKITLPVFAVTFAAIMFVQGPIYNILSIQKSYFAESVGIPIQQIGLTAKYGNLAGDQKTELSNIIDADVMAASYTPNTSNTIKFNWGHFNHTYLNEHQLEFLMLWANILPNNIPEYTVAYLLETDGQWHIGAIGYTVQLKQEENQPFDSTDLIGLREPISKVLTKITDQSIYNILFSEGVVIWAMFFSVVVFLYKKRYDLLLVIAPLVVLWLTLMIATPINYDFRYIFPIYLAVPVIIIFMLQNKSGSLVPRKK